MSQSRQELPRMPNNWGHFVVLLPNYEIMIMITVHDKRGIINVDTRQYLLP